MKHRDPICNRALDDDTPFRAFTRCRVLYFCSERCMDSFKHAQALYLGKQINKDQRKIYKTCTVRLPELGKKSHYEANELE
nr:hypothetical protein [Candidatus Sigynarchaeota archaeon]